MTQVETAAPASNAVRDLILSNPAAVLEDRDLLAALLSADESLRGDNVVDLRGLAISRLEERLQRLEDTHQSVLAAAYDNVSTTRQVHRAILAMVGPRDLEAFLRCLGTEVADILRVASVRLLIEPRPGRNLPSLPGSRGLIRAVQPGEVESYVNTWRGGRSPDVVLRRIVLGTPQGEYHKADAGPVRSEALIRLDIGGDYPSALLVLGASDPDQYHQGQATDLIELFGRVCERSLYGLMP